MILYRAKHDTFAGIRLAGELLLRRAPLSIQRTNPSIEFPRSNEPSLLLLGCPLSERFGVGRHRGTDELLEGSFVDLLSFTEVDCTPRVPFQTGVEELFRVFDGGSTKEGKLHNLLV